MQKHQGIQRRKPRQARALATYNSILQAAIQILERSGADALNTNAVAERAGVSIGTLYQYFPDKEAILLAAARRELETPQPGLARKLLGALIRALETFLRGETARPERARGRPPRSAGRPDGAKDLMAHIGEVFVSRTALPVLALRPLPVRFTQPR